MAQEGWYVKIDHLTEEQLAFLGYDFVRGNDEFDLVINRYTGDEYILDKGNRHLYVDDLNDAEAINSTAAVMAPPDSDT